MAPARRSAARPGRLSPIVALNPRPAPGSWLVHGPNVGWSTTVAVDYGTRMDEPNRTCPWCSTPIPATVKACPKCGAIVEGSIPADIPGLTVVDPKASLDRADDPIRTNMGHDVWSGAAFGATPDEHEAVEPPSEAVRLEMRKMELEAEIENAGTELMNPTGDESIDAGPPSVEAIEAHQAGLLDPTGPAGETDLADLAAPWEDPELEKRVEQWHSEASEPTEEPTDKPK